MRYDLDSIKRQAAWMIVAAALAAGACSSNGTGGHDAGGGNAAAGAGGRGGTNAGGRGGTTGAAGTTGVAGTTGAAATTGLAGVGGTTGAAGAAGTTGAAGTGGRGGTTGTAGSSGTSGTAGRGGTGGGGGTVGTGGAAGTGGSAGRGGTGGSGGGGGSAGTTGLGGTGGVATCTANGCGASQYCDLTPNTCSVGLGSCKDRPTGCTALVDPVCGCDGQVYGNTCEAAAAGHDVSDAGGCTVPTGTFVCGPRFCTRGTQYCEAMLGGAITNPGIYACHNLPAGCGATPTCACLQGNAQCGMCTMSASGDLMTACLFP